MGLQRQQTRASGRRTSLIVLLKLLSFILPLSFAQGAPEPFLLDSIELQGLHKTKAYVVHRELRFKEGETVTRRQLKDAQIRLENMRIFRQVDLQVKKKKTGGAKESPFFRRG